MKSNISFPNICIIYIAPNIIQLFVVSCPFNYTIEKKKNQTNLWFHHIFIIIDLSISFYYAKWDRRDRKLHKIIKIILRDIVNNLRYRKEIYVEEVIIPPPFLSFFIHFFLTPIHESMNRQWRFNQP